MKTDVCYRWCEMYRRISDAAGFRSWNVRPGMGTFLWPQQMCGNHREVHGEDATEPRPRLQQPEQFESIHIGTESQIIFSEHFQERIMGSVNRTQLCADTDLINSIAINSGENYTEESLPSCQCQYWRQQIQL